MNFFVYLNIFCFYDKKQKNISFDKVYCKYEIDIAWGLYYNHNENWVLSNLMQVEKNIYEMMRMIMTNYFIKYIRSIKKDDSVSEKLSVLLIVVLLLLQIIITFFVCRSNNFASYNNVVSQAISLQIANEESRKDNFSAIAAAIASNGKVLMLWEKENPTYVDLVEPCSEIRKFKAVSSYVSNIYVYNGKYEYIYDAYGMCFDINDNAVEKIKTGIDGYFNNNELFFAYHNPNQYEPQRISCFEIYRSASSRKDLIIFEMNTRPIIGEYKSIQNVAQGSMVVTTDGGKVIYGSDIFDQLEDISSTNIYKTSSNKETYNIVRHNDRRYLVCHSNSDKTNRRYIAMVPLKNITVGFLYGKNYFSLYICIILSILVLVRTLSIWRRFYRLFVGQRLSDIEKKKSKQYVMVYKECGSPTEKGNETLINYLHSKFDKPYFVAIQMVIDNYTELDEKYPQEDLTLIKYGLNNILNEIFEKYGFKFQLANDLVEKIEFIVAVDSKSSVKNIRNALTECQESFEEYIRIISSFYIGSVENRGNIYKSYSVSQNLSSYSFIYGENVIIDESSVTKIDDEEFENIKLLCDKIKTDIIGESDDYKNDMAILQESLKKASPSQGYELLCYLLFNICSSIKNIERKYNIENVIDIGDCFKTLLSAKYSGEVLQIIELLYYDIRSILPDKNDSKYDKIIEDCNKIIEENYQDANLSVEYIADKIGFSRGHLTRVYKQITGMSISTKIADCRLDAAAKLLVETNKKVSDIVNDVGYINSSHFTVTFKHKFGESPLNYRKRYGQRKKD